MSDVLCLLLIYTFIIFFLFIQVKPRFPDFKHKSTGRPLWLGSAPEWIKSEHERVAFDADDVNPKQESNEHTSPAKISDGGEHN